MGCGPHQGGRFGVVRRPEQCHGPCMTAKTPPAGWVVQVATTAPPQKAEGSKWVGRVLLGAPSFQYFNVAIASSDKAMEATTKHMAKTAATDGELSVVRALSSGEIAALSLKAGEVKPA